MPNNVSAPRICVYPPIETLETIHSTTPIVWTPDNIFTEGREFLIRKAKQISLLHEMWLKEGRVPVGVRERDIPKTILARLALLDEQVSTIHDFAHTQIENSDVSNLGKKNNNSPEARIQELFHFTTSLKKRMILLKDLTQEDQDLKSVNIKARVVFALTTLTGLAFTIVCLADKIWTHKLITNAAFACTAISGFLFSLTLSSDFPAVRRMVEENKTHLKNDISLFKKLDFQV